MGIRMVAEHLNGFSCPKGTHFLSSCILKGNWSYIMFSRWLSALSQQCGRSRAKKTKCRIIETQEFGQYSLLSRLFLKSILSVFSKLCNKAKLTMSYLFVLSVCVWELCVLCIHRVLRLLPLHTTSFFETRSLTEIEAHQFV